MGEVEHSKNRAGSITLTSSSFSVQTDVRSKISREKQGNQEMELSGNDFLEELLALRKETWETPLESTNDQLFFSTDFSFDTFENYINNPLANFQSSHDSSSSNLMFFNDVYGYGASLDELSVPHIADSSYNATLDASLDVTTPFMAQEEYPQSLFAEADDPTSFLGVELRIEESPINFKLEPMQESLEIPCFKFGSSAERKNRSKKLQGQPSKNLMAERRRRKRLNDRLSMLRAIVPKISKMDRTSTLVDTIDYLKELLEKINNMQREMEGKPNMEGNFKDVKPNEILVRNSPKFDVERKELDTTIEICCAGKPRLLLPMVDTVEALGLEIQQCVISCFHDFAMQASCFEESEQRTATTSEDIKQALFRNAGYGGRCL